MNTSLPLDYDNANHDCETRSKQYRTFTEIKHLNKMLENLTLKNVNKLICTQLNIHSITKKIDLLFDIVNDNIDFLMMLEEKLESSFPTRQFHIYGISDPYRIDNNNNGGGMLLYVRPGITSKVISRKMKILCRNQLKMMMMMMNCFRGMVDRRKAFSLISSRAHCQRFSPSRISDTPRAG